MPQTKRHWIDRAADPSTPTTEDNETVRSATFEYDGKYYLVPTIRLGEDGKLYKPENPLSEALDRGDAVEFDTQEEADRMSGQISDYIGRSRANKYARGGNVEQMNKLFAEGGMMDDSGDVVNGVKVPPGSLKEEVADDIPAQLSEGEFVVPADVVRFIGLEKLMAMRDKAKEGLKRMEEMGQMGNADEVDNPDQAFDEVDDETFSSEIDSILAEESSAMPEGFARGGFASGTDLTKASRNPMVDVRFFKNKEGKVMFITHINGVPLVPIPEGFSETDETYEQLIGSDADKKKAEEEAAKAEELKRLAALGMGTSSSGDSTQAPTGPVAAVNPDDRSKLIEIDREGNAIAKTVPKLFVAIATSIPAVGPLISKGIEKQNEAAKKAAEDWKAAKAAGNIYFDPEHGDEGDWVDMTKALDRGYGLDVKGNPVLTVKSLTPAADLEREGMEAFERAERQASLDASIVQKESRAREAAREKAAAEAKAAEEKAAAEKAAAEKAAAEAAAQRAAVAARQAQEERERAARVASQNYESSTSSSGSDSVGGYSAQSSYGSFGEVGAYGGGAGMAKGGMVEKRHKPTAKKKGLASKRK